MTITPTLYDTSTLLGVMRETDPVSNYWLDLCFNNVMTFDDEYIDFEKLGKGKRKLAPFVAPLAQGRPIFEQGSTVTRLKPAYIKPKDPVMPTRNLTRKPGELLNPTPMNPMARRNANIVDILQQQREAIERRWEWLAAQAIINGSVTLEDEDYPARVVDFGRASGHTVTLGSGARWGDSGVSIIGLIEEWRTLVRRASFGGPTNRLTVGTDAWDVMRKDPEVLKLLDTQTRGTEGNTMKFVRDGEYVEWVGRIGGNLDIYVYSDYYDVNGVATDFLDSKSVVLTGPNVMGYRCFGAIADVKANYQPLPIFPKNWVAEDPAVEYVMSQSSPLMVPVNPNNTLKAKVLA